MENDDERMLRSIEDLRSEVRELRDVVNMLVDIIVSMETVDDTSLDTENNMMGYDNMLKTGRYCM